MRVLVLSSVFPNLKQPTFGVFVKERMRHVAQHCELAVVAPIPWFPLNRLIRGPRWSGIPKVEQQDGLRVYHPRFFSVPRYLKSLDGFLYACSLLPFLIRLRRQFHFDLIDAHFAYPDGTAAALLGKIFRCPVTVTLRGTLVPLSRFRLRRIQIVWALGAASRIFSVSQSLKDLATSLSISPEKIRVIPNGVDPQVFRPGSREDARRCLGLQPDRAILLSVGSLSERKGHHRMLEALPRVVEKRREVQYIVVGGPGVEGDTGPFLTRLTTELGLEGHVLFVGPRPHEEIPHWLAAADIFCLATSNEGMANALLEALACGVPVITTPVGGNKEVVREGENGLLIGLGDRDELARTILRALETKWNRETIAARARRQSWNSTAAQVLQEFRQLVLSPGGKVVSTASRAREQR